ncbi:MAG TPA: MarR family transcriptional regulator [Candidatus Dormibacteraeota bacterium]|nr:MarR family transcriptional regulator [Candidatus Dormibacteraeota bacterium]
MPIPPSLANRPGALLTIATRRGQELARRRLSPLGLTVQLCGVLNILAAGPISQHDLGDQLGIDRTTMVELIDDLEKQRAVVRRRNPADRRSYALSLTPSGKALQKKAATAFDEVTDEVFDGLKPAERKVLGDMLRRVIEGVDAKLSIANSS